MKKIVLENTLANRFPLVAKEWVYELNGDKGPDLYSYGSHEKKNWRCEKGHIWEAQIKNRVAGSGCPYCCGKKVLKGYNDFASKCKSKLNIWNYEKNVLFKPDEIYYNSEKKVWWVCNKGHEWEARIRDISNGSKCPYCSSERLLRGFNDLETRFPEISKLWDYELNSINPSDIFPKSRKKIHWVCKKGHKWVAYAYNVVNNNGNCPICSGKKLAKGINDLESAASRELLAEWSYNLNKIGPDQITAHNNRKCWWECCKCGKKWETSPYKRVTRGDGCPFCGGKRPIIGKNDLATMFPEIEIWWSSNNEKCAKDYNMYSHKKVMFCCPTCKKVFERAIADQVERTTCPFCTGKKVIPGETDLASKQKELVSEWNYEKNRDLPNNYHEYSNKKVWWKCQNCGYEWRASINNRSQGKGCPKCSGMR